MAIQSLSCRMDKQSKQLAVIWAWKWTNREALATVSIQRLLDQSYIHEKKTISTGAHESASASVYHGPTYKVPCEPLLITVEDEDGTVQVKLLDALYQIQWRVEEEVTVKRRLFAKPIESARYFLRISNPYDIALPEDFFCYTTGRKNGDGEAIYSYFPKPIEKEQRFLCLPATNVAAVRVGCNPKYKELATLFRFEQRDTARKVIE